MSRIIMYAGLTAHMVVPELGGMICGLWQSPFHFTDGSWLWCYSESVILTPTKRGLSQPPEALGRRGGGMLQMQRGGMWGSESVISKRVYRLENLSGWIKYNHAEEKCWGRENDAERKGTCMSAQALLSILVTGDTPFQHSTELLQWSCSVAHYKTVLLSSQVRCV